MGSFLGPASELNFGEVQAPFWGTQFGPFLIEALI